MKSFYIWKFNPFLHLIQAKHFCWAPDQAKKISIQVCQEGELLLRTLNYFSKVNQVHFCMSLSVHKIHICLASVKQYLKILGFFFFFPPFSFFYTGNIKWQHLINLTGTNVMTSLICNIQAKAFILESGISWCTTYHSHYSNKIQTTITPLGELPGKNDNFHLTSNKNFWAHLEQYCWKPLCTLGKEQQQVLSAQPRQSCNARLVTQLHVHPWSQSTFLSPPLDQVGGRHPQPSLSKRKFLQAQLLWASELNQENSTKVSF